MILFGMGTIPLMTTAIYFSGLLKGTMRQKVQKLIPVFVVLVGANPWERHRNPFNIGSMLKNFGGGGHKDVGACRTETKPEAQKVVDYFTDFFNGTSS